MTDSLTPADPVMHLNLISHSKRRYPEKALAQRSIQDYKLRPGFVILGLAGGAAAFYAANSASIAGNSTSKLALNAMGVLLSASGFINLKPKGEPRKLDEERYLRTTGSVVQTDTIDVKEDRSMPVDLFVTYKGNTVFEEHLDELKDGQLNVSLAQNLNDIRIRGKKPGNFEVEANFMDSTYHYRFPISSVLEPYAEVTTDITPLRSQTSENPDNVLADLTRGSLIKIQKFADSSWYQVKYGNFKSYIDVHDANIIWHSRRRNNNAQIVALPRIPFGNSDIEAAIPKLRERTDNARALVITNQNYAPLLEDRRYAHRDGMLMVNYLNKALGYPLSNIHRITDLKERSKLEQNLRSLRSASSRKTELFIYLSGYGALKDGKLALINNPTKEVSSFILLDTLFQNLSSMPSKKIMVAADIDFGRVDSLSDRAARLLMVETASKLTQNANAAVIFGNRLGQPAGLYWSSWYSNKMHHIFPYFLAKAWQQKKTDLTDIYQVLNYNIPYISRKMNEHPQNPFIYGNRSISFINEE